MKKNLFIKLFVLSLLLLFLTGCTLSHLVSGGSNLQAGEYDKAVVSLESALKSNQEGKPLMLSPYGEAVNADYLSTFCLGISYMMLDEYKKSEKYFLQSVALYPDAAYMSYMGLAQMKYKQGKLEEAYNDSLEATKTVGTRKYYKMQKYLKMPPDFYKNIIEAATDFYSMRLLFKNLNYQMGLGNYASVINIGNQILNKTYKVHFGADSGGTKVDFMSDGGMADLNGIVKGDQILEINGAKIESPQNLWREADKVLTKYGNTVRYKIERNGRVIDIEAKMVYPEIEQTKLILQEAKLRMAGKSKIGTKESIGLWIKILEPKTARGIKIVGKQKAVFVILASGKDEVSAVTVNDVNCTTSEASLLEKAILPGKVKKYKVALPLVQGSNQFIVSAFDTKGKNIQQRIEIQGNETLSKVLDKIYDHKVAVVIGINKYNPWPSLEYAVNDAEAVREILSKMGYDKIVELYDRQATRGAINRVLGDDLLSMLGTNDSLLVYFAGHGATEPLKDGREEGYIIPVDASRDNYRGTAISMTQIHDLIKKYRAKHILFVFDSCYSGLGLKRGGGQKSNDAFAMNMATKKVRQILTAGGKDEQAQEYGGHGVFTQAFLDALNKQGGMTDKDGYIMASDLGQFVRKQVGEKTKFSQTPMFGWLDGEGDFIFEIN